MSYEEAYHQYRLQPIFCDNQATNSELADQLSLCGDKSIIVSSLELGRIMAEKGRAKFRANGICMYPNIRSGDLLHITPKLASDIKIGDIAVFRRGSKFFGHRTISKGHDDSGHYIITKPDNSDCRDGCPIYDNDILGVVSEIERKGKKVNPSLQLNKTERHYFSLFLRLSTLCNLAQARALDLVSSFQRSTIYQGAIASYLTRLDPTYKISVPLNSKQTCYLYRSFSIEDFTEFFKDEARSRSLDRWALALFIGDGKGPAASATFVLRHGDSCSVGWWVNDLHVRKAFRGTVLEKKLLHKAEQILAQRGARELWINLPKENLVDVKAFQSLGFQKVNTNAHMNLNSTFSKDAFQTPIILRRGIT